MEQHSLSAKVYQASTAFPEHWKVSCAEEVNGVAFPHLIIDNFFTTEEFNQIRQREADVKDKEIKIAHSLIRKNGEVKSDVFDAPFLTGVDRKYRPPLLAMLGVLSKKKTSLYEFSDFHLISTGPDYEHAIHDDIPKKLLSVVIYINPEQNNGTFIHDGRYTKEPVGEIEWKQNRAFVFSRLDRKTLHSYAANKVDNRFCVVYNLNTYKAFKAHWAEGNFLKFLEKGLKYE
ncbi:hypothetical protein [Marinobacterium lutimaris]|uniref:2OG-Fe(II) oxygenase superfamily protein n=1 Tax=Marinobacterium lutimaris TaxID=568106 RepID=A0A1H5Y1W8_9GAMM|nr:hypothetical protein [Marinobacterium lutimaris]SEG17898.1 hypothetical protein SAMN05444390_1011583 [Marinobacterium lutimaris]